MSLAWIPMSTETVGEVLTAEAINNMITNIATLGACPRCAAYLGTAGSTTAGTDTAVPFDTYPDDQAGSGIVASLGTDCYFVVPYTGWYQVCGQMKVTGATDGGQITLSIAINSEGTFTALLSGGATQTFEAQPVGVVVAGLVYLTSGQGISLVYLTTDSLAFDIDPSNNFMTAHLVGQSAAYP